MRRAALVLVLLSACNHTGDDLFKKIHPDAGIDAFVLPPVDANEPPDASPPDAGPPDAAAFDARPPDAAPPDA